MAEAGRLARLGPTGLLEAAEKYAARGGKEILRGIIAADPLVSASAKEVVEAVLLPHSLQQREIAHKERREHKKAALKLSDARGREELERAGFVSTKWLASKYGVDILFANRLAKCRQDTVSKFDTRFVKWDEEVESIVLAYEKRVAKAALLSVMELGSLDVQDLVEVGVFEPLEAVLLPPNDGNCITGQSLSAARERMEGRAIPSSNAKSFRTLWKERPNISVGILFAAIVTSDFAVARLRTHLPSWLDEFGTEDPTGLDRAVIAVWDANPELAKGVLRRTGLKREQRAIRYYPDGLEYGDI